jgi:hypothetical protein
MLDVLMMIGLLALLVLAAYCVMLVIKDKHSTQDVPKQLGVGSIVTHIFENKPYRIVRFTDYPVSNCVELQDIGDETRLPVTSTINMIRYYTK